MKAVICTHYGPPEVLQLQEVPRPTPKHYQVGIKIYATAVTASDSIVRSAALPMWNPMGLAMRVILGFTGPRQPILGMILAGEIESIGQGVKRFKVGDRVYAYTVMRFGTYAEYTCVPENGTIALAPANLTYEEAAAIPYGGMIALHYLKKAHLQPGQKILIYGASGAIGTAAVQLAKHMGAHVTGVCSTANLDLVRSLGADAVIDYTQEELTARHDRYDFILDAVGKRKSARLASKSICQKILTPNGQYLSVDDGSPQMLPEALVFLTELIEADKFRPVIDRVYPLEQIVEAHRHVDAGHKKGNVVITVAYR